MDLFEAAISDLTSAIHTGKLNQSFLLNKRGECYIALNNYDKANDDLKKAIEINPKNPRVYSNMGHIEYFTGNYNKAIQLLNKSISIDSNEMFDFYIRGICYSSINMQNEAIKDFTFVIKNQDSMYRKEAYFERGVSFYLIGKYQKGIDDFNRLLSDYTKNADVYFFRGKCYFELRKSQLAFNDFSTSVGGKSKYIKEAYNFMAILGEVLNIDFCKYFKKSCELGYEDACTNFKIAKCE